MNTLHYDIKGKFDESERQRKLFSISVCGDDITSFEMVSKTPCDLGDLKQVLDYLDNSKFFYLMNRGRKSNEEPLKDFHIGGNYRMVLSKKQPNTEESINRQNNIILWKIIYKEYMNAEAFISDKEVRLLGSRKYTEKEMRGFFECDLYFAKGLETVTSFVNNFSAVVNYINSNHIKGATSEPVQSKYPNRWDYDFEQTLQPSEMPKYWEHLRNLGLQAVKNRFGKTSHWEKVERI